MAARKSSLALVTAQAFLEEFGLECRNDLARVTAQLGLTVREVDATTFDGALVRLAGHAVGTIAIRASIPENSRKRFTLAHELGHYVLPNQQELLATPCTAPAIESWSKRLDRNEIEANQFAAEILMPRHSMACHLGDSPSLDTARAIASMFDTSLTASMFRLVELSSYRIAMTVSKEHRTTWYQVSEEFGRSIRTGPIDSRTLAHDLLSGNGTKNADFGYVPADAWLFEQNLRDHSQIWEHSVVLRSYGMVLSLLEIRDHIEVRTDFDEDECDILDPEEFTLRRKRWPR